MGWLNKSVSGEDDVAFTAKLPPLSGQAGSDPASTPYPLLTFLKLVGATRFERAATRSQTESSTWLSYTPMKNDTTKIWQRIQDSNLCGVASLGLEPSAIAAMRIPY